MNIFSRNLVGSLALLITTSGAFAAAPATSAPPANPASAKSAAPAAPPKPVSILDAYINELAATLKLSDSDKKDIETCYTDDGPLLKNILNNDSLSPLEQAREVSDARDARNKKIEDMLLGNDRMQAFYKIEAKYRVALTEFAANGGLVPPPTPPPTPAAPAPASATPATNTPAATPAHASTQTGHRIGELVVFRGNVRVGLLQIWSVADLNDVR